MADDNNRGRGRGRGRTPLEKEERRKFNKESRQKLARIFTYIGPYRIYFFLGLISMVISTVLFMAFPYLSGLMVDAAKGENVEIPYLALDSISDIGFAMIGVLVLQGVFSFGRVIFLARVSEPAMADMRKDIFSKLISLNFTFFDKRRTGELISRITADAGTLYDMFSVNLIELIRQVLTLVFGIGALLILSPKLTSFMLATFPVVVIIAIVFGRIIRRKSKETQDRLAETNVIVEEALQAIEAVKSFTGELFEKLRYGKSMHEQVKVALSAAWYRGLFISLSFVLLFGGIVAVIWYGAYLIQNGDVTDGGLFAFVFYTGLIGGSMAGFSSLYAQLQRAIGSSERVLDILGEDGEPTVAESALPPLDFQGHIQYQDVRFAYPTREDMEVLKGISLEIQPGEKAALVGHSGAGKSTMVQLLMRFYPLNGGEIMVDGQAAAEYDLRRYREQIGIVPQEVLLFGGTIRENISYGKPSASEEEIVSAAKRANAWQFIESFPEGLDTIVGERGVKLSGGQRQRIAIARAILKDPAILILDEATSSLDAESEALVQEALEELMHNRTTIMIAHRLGTIRKADKIYVLDQGQIIESGTHEELLARDEGTYTNLVKLQLTD
ncbi:MAG TPA: multidrug ABC transporter ATP-binding protein [Cytophagales bacterium]|nr:multidrug ABC transporter ATP-binding protein [Cytophagales bacterium]HAP61472.1 multidrug ABC transporter ATP-binding protein [Cytophagales bacterium]